MIISIQNWDHQYSYWGNKANLGQCCTRREHIETKTSQISFWGPIGLIGSAWPALPMFGLRRGITVHPLESTTHPEYFPNLQNLTLRLCLSDGAGVFTLLCSFCPFQSPLKLFLSLNQQLLLMSLKVTPVHFCLLTSLKCKECYLLTFHDWSWWFLVGELPLMTSLDCHSILERECRRRLDWRRNRRRAGPVFMIWSSLHFLFSGENL